MHDDAVITRRSDRIVEAQGNATFRKNAKKANNQSSHPWHIGSSQIASRLRLKFRFVFAVVPRKKEGFLCVRNLRIPLTNGQCRRGHCDIISTIFAHNMHISLCYVNETFCPYSSFNYAVDWELYDSGVRILSALISYELSRKIRVMTTRILMIQYDESPFKLWYCYI